VSTELIIIVAVVMVAAILIAWWAGQRRRTERLRDQFGNEYDRTVKTAGDRARAEADLESRQERVEALHITALDPRNRDAFAARWREVQAQFVDQPAQALAAADGLIAEVMRARGYPVGDFDQRAADVSVDHPQVVDHYRTAHAIAVKQRDGTVDTEAMRQAMVHYRALFADLLDMPDDRARATDAPLPSAEAVAEAEPVAPLNPSRATTTTTTTEQTTEPTTARRS